MHYIIWEQNTRLSYENVQDTRRFGLLIYPRISIHHVLRTHTIIIMIVMLKEGCYINKPM